MRFTSAFIITITTTTLLAAAGAVAQTTKITETDGGEVTSLSVSRSDCLRLVRHRAGGDVAFKPGVDVRGKKIVPADVEGRVDMAPKGDVVIDFGVDLAEKYNINPGSGLSATAAIGKVVYNMDSGTFTINDKPLEPPERRAVDQACRMANTP